MLLVQLHVADRAERINRSDRTDQPVPVSASRIAARHSDRPVAVEVVRWRTAPRRAARRRPRTVAPEPARREPTAGTGRRPPSRPPRRVIDATADEDASEPSRPRLLAVLAFPDTDELEVHLVLDGKRTIGRAPASTGIVGAVEATIDAVRELGAGIQPASALGPRARRHRSATTTRSSSRSRSTASTPCPAALRPGRGHEPHRRRRPRHARRVEPPPQPHELTHVQPVAGERARYHRMPLPS